MAPLADYQQQVGTLTLTTAGITNQVVLEGGDDSTVDLGIGRLSQSALPGWMSADGTSGEMILLGHRTSKLAPFANLVFVDAGDKLVFTDNADVDHPYIVTDVTVVSVSEELYVPTPGAAQTLRLIACTCPIPAGGVVADAVGGCVSERVVVTAVAAEVTK